MKLVNSNSFTATNTVRSAATITVLVLFLTAAHGEDLTTLDGQTYTNITDVVKYPKLIVFTYNDNRKSAAITNLPEEFRAKYGIIIKTNAPVVAAVSRQQQSSSIDLFLWQNRENKLEQREDANYSTNLWTLGSNTAEKDKYWSISLQSAEVSLRLYTTTRFYKEDANHIKAESSDKVETTDEMSFDVGSENFISTVFEKFLEWNNVAATNHAVDFEKEITRRTPNKAWVIYHQQMFGDAYASETVIYNFEWKDNHASLNVQQPDPYTGNFDRDDIIQLQSFLKLLPGMKEKLVANIRNKAAQKDLFK